MNRCIFKHTPDWDEFNRGDGTVPCADCGYLLSAELGEGGWIGNPRHAVHPHHGTVTAHLLLVVILGALGWFAVVVLL